MQFDWWTLALQTVNFLILVWLLHRFLYRPVLAVIETRRTEIDAQYANAHKAEAKAQAELAEIEVERAGIASEREAALTSAANEAEVASAARRARAEADAKAMLDQTRKSLELERAAATAETRRQALDLAVSMAQKLLDEFPPELRADAWLDRVERYIADLPPEQRADIAKQLDGRGSLRVVSAVALPASVMTKWQERLDRMFDVDVPIDFAVDPALIAGVELLFPNTVLRFSWRSVMDAMQTELATDENPG